MTTSLFQPACNTARYLKVLLHGGPGTGKTLTALSFPAPVVLDLEGGTVLYSDVAPFDVLRTKDIRKIEAAIEELVRDPQGYGTIIVDPLTVLWQLLQDAGQGLVDGRKNGRDSLETGQVLSAREWGLIKRRYNSILTRLNNLPLHVVLIARDTDLYEGKGDALTKIGIKPDVEKSTPYVADLVLRCEAGEGRFSAVVEKSRLRTLPLNTRLTGHGLGVVGGFFARHLAAAADLQTGGAAPAALEEEAAVVGGNAALLEPPTPALLPPLANYYTRIEGHFARLSISPAEQKSVLAAVVGDGIHKLTEIEDRATLTRLGQTLVGWQTADDVAAYFTRLDRAQAVRPHPQRATDPPLFNEDVPTVPARTWDQNRSREGTV